MPNTFRGKGNLADAPTLKTVMVAGEERKVAEMRVMFDEYSYDDAKEQYIQDGGFWLGVSVWDHRAEDAARLLRKGCRVSVEGTLRQFQYTVEGTDVKAPGFQVLADDITLCMGRIESVAFKAKRETPQKEGAAQ
jgi:single-strand DNA-binding protein